MAERTDCVKLGPLICPSGKSRPTRENLSSPREKNISLFQKPKSVVMFAPSRPHKRGGSRSSRTLRRDAVDAAVSLDERTGADGEGVWSWRPDAGAKVVGHDPANDGGKRARSPGRSRISRKTIAQGRPDDPAPPVVTTVCFLPMHTGRGCALSTRSSLRPLILEGRFSCTTRADCAAGTWSRALSSPSPRPFAGRGPGEGLPPRTVCADRAPHPKFAAQISTSPRKSGARLFETLRARLFEIRIGN
jgi:hypothetical protein